MSRTYQPIGQDLAREAIARAGLSDIHDKIENGERLDYDNGVRLFESPELAAVGLMANEVRIRRHGHHTFYNINQHVNYTNICLYSCKFCAFAAKEGEERAYLMTGDDVESKVRAELHRPVTEVHMVAGIHPNIPYAWYCDTLRAIKDAYPHIHLKCWTAVEIDFMARLSRKPLPEIFADLHAAGLGSMPGGGAEIFAPEIREVMAFPKTQSGGDLMLEAPSPPEPEQLAELGLKFVGVKRGDT
jgi:aminodeoxyfutalosine synthase